MIFLDLPEGEISVQPLPDHVRVEWPEGHVQLHGAAVQVYSVIPDTDPVAYNRTILKQPDAVHQAVTLTVGGNVCPAPELTR